MLRHMLLTIGLPVHNDKNALSETVKSIAREMAEIDGEVEIIVSDNASPDRSFEAALGLQKDFPQVKILRQAINVGFSGNLRAIATASNATYIWFIGAGGTIQPGILKEVVNFLRENAFDWGTVMGLFNFHDYESYTPPKDLLWVGGSDFRDSIEFCNHAISLNIIRTAVFMNFTNCTAHAPGRVIGDSTRGPDGPMTAWMDEKCYWPHLEAIFNYGKENNETQFKWFQFRQLSILLNDNKNGNWDKGLAAMNVFDQWAQVVRFGSKQFPDSRWLKGLDYQLHGPHLLRFVFMITKDGSIPRRNVITILKQMDVSVLYGRFAMLICLFPKSLVKFIVMTRKIALTLAQIAK